MNNIFMKQFIYERNIFNRSMDCYAYLVCTIQLSGKSTLHWLLYNINRF